MHRSLTFVLIGVLCAIVNEARAACGSDPTTTCQGRCGGAGVGLCYCDSDCKTNLDCCPDFEECCPHCVSPCEGKECGDDGCGGSCGSCGIGPQWSCVAGKCVCTPQCAGAVCGKDGCGGSCGTCPAGQVCAGGKCVAQPCIPQCTARQCGDGGCPDQPDACGVCPPGQTCSMWGQCLGCVGQCAGKECGDDGCGNPCGTCQAGKICNASGQCVNPPCMPDCAGKECGDDGCGGSCGTCPPGKTCGSDGRCAALVSDPGQADSTGVADAYQPDEQVLLDPSEPETEPDTMNGTTPASETTVNPGRETPCPPGTMLSYGRCVTTPGPGTRGGASGGCSAGAKPLHFGWLLCVLIGALASRRRGRT